MELSGCPGSGIIRKPRPRGNSLQVLQTGPQPSPPCPVLTSRCHEDKRGPWMSMPGHCGHWGSVRPCTSSCQHVNESGWWDPHGAEAASAALCGLYCLSPRGTQQDAQSPGQLGSPRWGEQLLSHFWKVSRCRLVPPTVLYGGSNVPAPEPGPRSQNNPRRRCQRQVSQRAISWQSRH